MSTQTASTTETPMVKNRWFWGMIIALVVILGGVWILFSQTLADGGAAVGEAIELEPAPIAGHPAPDFELVNLEGEMVRLSDFQGTPVIINFWATWCGPCRAEFPDFQEAAVDNADSLVIIGINNTANDQADLVGDFVAEMGATFPIVLDESGDAAETYNVLGLPTTIFVDRDGIVSEVFTGPINKAYIEAKLSEL
ncbi:MAG: TlpA disulfide reductase family protein [Chloroflexota bacterium]